MAPRTRRRVAHALVIACACGMSTTPRTATKKGVAPAAPAAPAATAPKKQTTSVDGVEIAAMKNNVLKWKPRALEADPATVRAAAAAPVHGPVLPRPVHGPARRDYSMEVDHPELAATYWNDPRIHTFGNVGPSGAVHAVVAPAFTVALDAFAYLRRCRR